MAKHPIAKYQDTVSNPQKEGGALIIYHGDLMGMKRKVLFLYLWSWTEPA